MFPAGKIKRDANDASRFAIKLCNTALELESGQVFNSPAEQVYVQRFVAAHITANLGNIVTTVAQYFDALVAVNYNHFFT